MKANYSACLLLRGGHLQDCLVVVMNQRGDSTRLRKQFGKEPLLVKIPHCSLNFAIMANQNRLLTADGIMETARTKLTGEEIEMALAELPDVTFLLVGDIYYTVCCDAFEFHTVPENKRNRPIDAHLKTMHERPGRPFLIGREMTRPEQAYAFDSHGSAIVSALEHAFGRGFSKADEDYVFDIRLLAYTPRDHKQDPFDYYARPDERELFGGQYDRGLIRFQNGRIVAVTENLIDPLRACVADRLKTVEEAEYTWEDVFSPELQYEVFRCWQQSLEF